MNKYISFIIAIMLAGGCAGGTSKNNLNDAANSETITNNDNSPRDQGIEVTDAWWTADLKPVPLCGNAMIDPAENCDIAIRAGKPGSCPTACNDESSCTKDSLVGTQCTTICAYAEITICDNTQADGCCPAGCNATTDKDCSSSCGNGIVESGEACDKGITSGTLGACPVGCDDNNACTKDKLVGSECTVTCSNVAITACSQTVKDGCCPAGCVTSTDADCLDTCGNGVLDQGETCDTNIVAPKTGACPTTCNDNNNCTNDAFVGSKCTTSCSHTQIIFCRPFISDGCCPSFCNKLTDVDCSAS